MAYEVNVLADSINEEGERLVTMEATFPRMVLAEFNTHRMLSRNSASSRAIPVEKQLQRVLEDPFIPVHWGVNQAGMQAEAELDEQEAEVAETIWLHSRDKAVLGAVALIGGLDRLKDVKLRHEIGQIEQSFDGMIEEDMTTPIHKQIANRLLEPFMWHTVIVTASEWSNFFALRANPQAQPEIQTVANMMQDAYREHQPVAVGKNEWHLPLVQPDELELPMSDLCKIAVGRCARVSYLTHDTGRRDTERDIALHDTLLKSGHMSPFEHVARPMSPSERRSDEFSGNFRGWHQYRKDLAHEDDYSQILALAQPKVEGLF